MADDIPIVDIKINIDPNSLKQIAALSKELKELNEILKSINKEVASLGALAGRLREVNDELRRLTSADLKRFRQELGKVHAAFCRDICFEEFLANSRKFLKTIDEFVAKSKEWRTEFEELQTVTADFATNLKALDFLLRQVNTKLSIYQNLMTGGTSARTRGKKGEETPIEKAVKTADKILSHFMKVNDSLNRVKQSTSTTLEKVNKIVNAFSSLINKNNEVAESFRQVSKEVKNAGEAMKQTAEQSSSRISRLTNIVKKLPSALYAFNLAVRYRNEGFPAYLPPEDLKRYQSILERWDRFGKELPRGIAILSPFLRGAKFLTTLTFYSHDRILRSILGIDAELLKTQYMINKLKEAGIRLDEEEIKKTQRLLKARAMLINILKTLFENKAKVVSWLNKFDLQKMTKTGLTAATWLVPSLRTVAFTRIINYQFAEPVFWLLREFSELGENMSQIIQQFMGAFGFSLQYLRDRIIPRIEFMMRGLPPKLIELAREYSFLYGLPMEYILRSMEDVYRRTKSIEATEYIFKRSWELMSSTLTSSEKEMLKMAGKVYKLNEIYQMTFMKEMLRLSAEWGGGDASKAVDYLTRDIENFAKLTAKITMLIVMLFESIAPIVDAIANVISFYAMLETKVAQFIKGHMSLANIKKFFDERLNEFVEGFAKLGKDMGPLLVRALQALYFELTYVLPKVVGVIAGIFTQFVSSALALIVNSLKPETILIDLPKIISEVVTDISRSFYEGFMMTFIATAKTPQERVERIKQTANIFKTIGEFIKNGIIGFISKGVVTLMDSLKNIDVQKTIGRMTIAAAAAIGGALRALVRFLGELIWSIPWTLIVAVVHFIKELVTNPQGIWQGFVNVLATIGKSILIIISGIVLGVLDVIHDTINGPIRQILSDLADIGEALGKYFKPLADFMTNVFNVFVDNAKKLIDFISNIIEKILDVLKVPIDMIMSFFKVIHDFFTGVWERIRGAIEWVLGHLGISPEKAANAVVSTVKKSWEETVQAKRKELENLTSLGISQPQFTVTTQVHESYNKTEKELNKAQKTLLEKTNETKKTLQTAATTVTNIATSAIDVTRTFLENLLKNATMPQVEPPKVETSVSEGMVSLSLSLQQLQDTLSMIKSAKTVNELQQAQKQLDNIFTVLYQNIDELVKAAKDSTHPLHNLLKSLGLIAKNKEEMEKKLSEIYVKYTSEINNKLKKLQKTSSETAQSVDELNSNLKNLNETLKFTVIGGEYVPIPGNYGTLIPTNEKASPVAIYSLVTKAEQLYSTWTPFHVAKPIYKLVKKQKEGKEVEVAEFTGKYTYGTEVWNINTLQRFFGAFEPFFKSFTIFTNLFQANVDALMSTFLKLEKAIDLLQILSGAAKSFGGIAGILEFEQFKNKALKLGELIDEAKRVSFDIFMKKLNYFIDRTAQHLKFFIAHAKELDEISKEASFGYQSFRLTENLLNSLKDFGSFFNYVKNQFGEDLENFNEYMRSVFGIIDSDVIASSYAEQAKQIELNVKRKFKLDKYWSSYVNVISFVMIDWISKFTGTIMNQVFSSLRNLMAKRYDLAQFGTGFEKLSWLSSQIDALNGMYYKLILLFARGFIDEETFKELMNKLNEKMKKLTTEFKNLLLSSLDDVLSDLPEQVASLLQSIKSELDSLQIEQTFTKTITSLKSLKLSGDAITKVNAILNFMNTIASAINTLTKLKSEGKIDEKTFEEYLKQYKALLDLGKKMLAPLMPKVKSETQTLTQFMSEYEKWANSIYALNVPNVTTKSPFSLFSSITSFIDWFKQNVTTLKEVMSTKDFTDVKFFINRSVEDAKKIEKAVTSAKVIEQATKLSAATSALVVLTKRSDSYFSKYLQFVHTSTFWLYNYYDALHDFEINARKAMDIGNATFSEFNAELTNITSNLDNLWMSIDKLERVAQKGSIMSTTKLEAAKRQIDVLKKKFDELLAPIFADIYSTIVEALGEINVENIIKNIKVNKELVKRKLESDMRKSAYQLVFSNYEDVYAEIVNLPSSLTDALSLLSNNKIAALLATLSEVAPEQASALMSQVEQFKLDVEPIYKQIFAQFNASIIEAALDALSSPDVQAYVKQGLSDLSEIAKESMKDVIKQSIDEMVFNAFVNSLGIEVANFTAPTNIDQMLNLPLELIRNVPNAVQQLVRIGAMSRNEGMTFLTTFKENFGALAEAYNEASKALISTFTDIDNATTSMLRQLALQTTRMQTEAQIAQTQLQSRTLLFENVTRLMRGTSLAQVRQELAQKEAQVYQQIFKIETKMLSIDAQIDALRKKRAELIADGYYKHLNEIKLIDEQINVLQAQKQLLQKQENALQTNLTTLRQAKDLLAVYADESLSFANQTLADALNFFKSFAHFGGSISNYVTRELSAIRSITPNSINNVIGALQLLLGAVQSFIELTSGASEDAKKIKKIVEALFGKDVAKMIFSEGKKSAEKIEKILTAQFKQYEQILSEPTKKFFSWFFNEMMKGANLIEQLAYRMRLSTETFIETLEIELKNIDYARLEKLALQTTKKTALANVYRTNLAMNLSEMYSTFFGIDERGNIINMSEMYNRTIVKTIKLSKNVTMTLETFNDALDFTNRTINGLIDSLDRMAKLDFSGIGEFVDSLMRAAYLMTGLGIIKPEQVSELTFGALKPIYAKSGELLGYQFDLNAIVSSISNFSAQILQVLSSALAPVIAIFANFANTIASMLLPILTPLIASIASIAGPLLIIVGAMIVLVPVVDALAKVLGLSTKGMDMFLSSVMNVLGALMNFGFALAKLIIEPIAIVLNALGYLVAPIFNFIAQLINIITPFINMIADFIATLWNAVEPIFAALGDVISSILNVVLSVIEIIVNAINAVLSFLKPVIDFIVNVIGFIASLIASVIEFIASVINAIIGFLQMLGLVHSGGNEEPSVVNVTINMENVHMGGPEEAQELGENLAFTIKRKWKTF